MPKKNEIWLSLNAEEYGQNIWLTIGCRPFDGAGEDYFLLIFNTHISFQSCNCDWHSTFSPTTFFEIGLFKLCLQFSHPLNSAPYTTPSNWTFKPGTGATSVKERTAIGKDGKGINVDAVGTVNGVSIHEFDLDSVDDKPWRKPGKKILKQG